MLSRLFLAGFFIIAGSYHFISAKSYLPMMPSYLPWHLPLIYLSGLAEIAGGIGVLIPRFRKAAGYGLIALLLAIFPANIHMLLHGAVIGGKVVPEWILIARLPLQFVMIWWVYVAAVKIRRRS